MSRERFESSNRAEMLKKQEAIKKGTNPADPAYSGFGLTVRLTAFLKTESSA